MMKRSASVESGKAALFALAAAVLYACSMPLSKRLLLSLPPVLLAGLLYFGAGAGAVALLLIGGKRARPQGGAAMFSRQELPFVLAMVLLDVLAPILLLFGLRSASAASASLLNNFEIVATALFALLLFRESVSFRLWIAVGLITLGSCLLTFDADGGFTFSGGAVLVLLATVCWGLENNCTRKLAQNNPVRIVAIKGIGSGTISLTIGFLAGERLGGVNVVLLALLVGFFTYGLSIACYIRAQRTLGAAKTSAYYAAAPFIGALLSFLLLGERPNVLFFLALLLLLAGAYFTTFDRSKTT
ncbi:MAG: DMT family transporter [Eubacteriales bacterium]|jgi:drug/metabolite transporter (DMT)-like permease|nr:DMT family transporter [Eubacteriales bacterium]